MQAKQRVCSALGPVKALEDMNLGQSQELSDVYKRNTCCRNGKGAIIEEVYGDEASARTALLFHDKPLAKGRAKKLVEDAGSCYNGFEKKCLVNAVLACVDGESRERMRDYFSKHCANYFGFGACGSSAAAKKLNFVRRALRDCGI